MFADYYFCYIHFCVCVRQRTVYVYHTQGDTYTSCLCLFLHYIFIVNLTLALLSGGWSAPWTNCMPSHHEEVVVHSEEKLTPHWNHTVFWLMLWLIGPGLFFRDIQLIPWRISHNYAHHFLSPFVKNVTRLRWVMSLTCCHRKAADRGTKDNSQMGEVSWLTVGQLLNYFLHWLTGITRINILI